MFGIMNFRSRRRAIEARANQIVRMVTLIRTGLKTKSYDEFVASFSNPVMAKLLEENLIKADEPDVFDRHRLKQHFMMKISETCWYSGTAMYDVKPGFILQGGGDDNGVFITLHTEPDRTMLSLDVPPFERAGRDARAMVRLLRVSQGWLSMADIEKG